MKGLKPRAASLHLQLECKITYSDASFAPEQKIREASADETSEIAFDQTRLYSRMERDLKGPLPYKTISFWDGHVSMSYGMGATPYQWAGTPGGWAPLLTASLPWLRAERHEYWWYQIPPGTVDTHRPAEEFVLAGPEIIRGHDCYALYDCHGGAYEYDVGVEDHRLYGLVRRILQPADYPAEREIGIQTAQLLGKEPSGSDDPDGIAASLPEAKQAEFWREASKRVRPMTIPQTVFLYDDYQQIAPDCWMPMWMEQQLKTIPGRTGGGTDATMRVTLAEKDKPLPENLFQVQIPDGAIVTDTRYNPELRYTFQKNVPQPDVAGLLADARQARQARLQKLPSSYAALGKPAAPFFRGQWLNTKPLDWPDFKGKVVLVHFWAEWDSKSLENMPVLEDLSQQTAATGIVVIGVHPPGSDAADIQRAIGKSAITFPVYIYIQPVDRMAAISQFGDERRQSQFQDSWGWLFDQFGVRAIPETFLVDQSGKIVAHGSIGAMIAHASSLSVQP